MIRIAIVDDEPVARSYLRSLIEPHTDLEIVAECCNGHEAVEQIPKSRPDLVFLDVRMPGMDGFDLVGRLPQPIPSIVFVTAHDDYATQAFDVHALDYLLKPFDRERFEDSLLRARRHLESRETEALNRRLQALLSSMDSERETVYLERLAVREKEEMVLVRVEDIDWIGAESNYLSLYVGGQVHLIRYSLGALEKELDPIRFARIHRSTMVNLDRIRILSPIGHGDYRVHLIDGTELTLSRRYRDRIRGVLPEFG